MEKYFYESEDFEIQNFGVTLAVIVTNYQEGIQTIEGIDKVQLECTEGSVTANPDINKIFLIFSDIPSLSTLVHELTHVLNKLFLMIGQEDYYCGELTAYLYQHLFDLVYGYLKNNELINLK